MVVAKRRFGRISAVYWLLTAYMVAALVWWFIELMQLNEQLHAFRIGSAGVTVPAAEIERRRNIVQYVGEGSMFLLLTLLGAAFVHRAARRRIRLDEQQRNFMMAVTHELKTPIAVIRLNLETLRKHTLDDTTRTGLLADNLREADRLEDLCDKILLSSRYDAGGVVMTRETLDLSALTRETLDDCMHRHAERRFHADITNGIHATGDRLLLRLAMNNLLENAVRYSPAETAIHLSLQEVLNASQLRVSDEGVGIPDHEKKRLFRKFHRIGREDTRRAKGTGLGLYLTRRIASDHGGSVRVEDNHPRGSTFIIELPKTQV
ncbi:MAG: two-component sensor histidine kinase [Chitinophagia bacterium]|nr:two-component sensor histidine kinase [Chitinophagia bacterium]